jgi:hypothetical protein
MGIKYEDRKNKILKNAAISRPVGPGLAVLLNPDFLG